MMRLVLALALLAITGPAWGGDIRLQDLRERLAAPVGTEYAWKAVGPAQVIDGDTILLLAPRFHVCPPPDSCPEEYSAAPDMTIRLHGIDAPELEQTCTNRDDTSWRCGEIAAYELINLIGDREVICFGGGSEMGTWPGSYHVAICSLDSKTDLAGRLLLRGLAVALYLDTSYGETSRALEQWAAADHEGMWRGSFVRPEAWRQRRDKIDSILEDLREREREIGPLRDN